MRCCFVVLDAARASGVVHRCKRHTQSVFCMRHATLLDRPPSIHEIAALRRVGLSRKDIGPFLWGKP